MSGIEKSTEDIIAKMDRDKKLDDVDADYSGDELSTLQTPKESPWWTLIGSLTMEPGFLLYMIASVMGNLIATDLQIDRACRINLGYNDTICDQLMNK